MKNKIKSFALAILSVLTVSMIITCVVMAWTEPAGTPPVSNVAAPINSGSVNQTKTAALGFGNGTIFGITYWIDKIGDDLAFKTGNNLATAVTNFFIGSNGYVGIGTTNPGTNLEINGQIKITGGDPGVNKVLTSDANGKASWQDLPATCSSLGHNCGDWPDGWGNTLHCGTCSLPQICKSGTCAL